MNHAPIPPPCNGEFAAMADRLDKVLGNERVKESVEILKSDIALLRVWSDTPIKAKKGLRGGVDGKTYRIPGGGEIT